MGLGLQYHIVALIEIMLILLIFSLCVGLQTATNRNSLQYLNREL